MLIIGENDFVIFSMVSGILTIRAKKATATDKEFEFAEKLIVVIYDRMIESNKKMSIIFDITELGTTQFHLYNRWAMLFKNNTEKTKRCIHKSGILTNNILVKGVVNSVLYLYTPVRPFIISSDIDKITFFINN